MRVDKLTIQLLQYLNILQALTDAVEKGLIFAKPYSKTNILYCPKQEIIENVDEVEQEVCSMIAEATNQLTELNEKVRLCLTL
jgi:hypothetical protein